MIIDGKPLPEVLDEAMIRAVVHDFYDRIREDKLLGPDFNADRVTFALGWPKRQQARHLA